MSYTKVKNPKDLMQLEKVFSTVYNERKKDIQGVFYQKYGASVLAGNKEVKTDFFDDQIVKQRMLTVNR